MSTFGDEGRLDDPVEQRREEKCPKCGPRASRIKNLQKQDAELREQCNNLKREDRRWRERVMLLLDAKKGDDDLVKGLKKEMVRLHSILVRLEEQQSSGFNKAVSEWDRDATLGEIARLRVAAQKKGELAKLYEKQLAQMDQARIKSDLELSDCRKQMNILKTRLKSAKAPSAGAHRLEQLEAQVATLKAEKKALHRRFTADMAAKNEEMQTMHDQLTEQDRLFTENMEKLRTQLEQIKKSYYRDAGLITSTPTNMAGVPAPYQAPPVEPYVATALSNPTASQRMLSGTGAISARVSQPSSRSQSRAEITQGIPEDDEEAEET